MTEPTGELFEAASSIRAVRLANEERAAQEAAREEKKRAQDAVELRQKQRLIDRKKAADKKLSNERAAAFVEIMHAHHIPTTSVYRIEHRMTGDRDVKESSYKFARPGVLPTLLPRYEILPFEYGVGWIIRDSSSTLELDGEDGRGPHPNLVLLEDLTTREFDLLEYKKLKGIALSQNRSDNKWTAYPGYYEGYTWTDKSPLESPYAGEGGLRLLGSVIDNQGIVSD